MKKLRPGYEPDVIIADYHLKDGRTGPGEITLIQARFGRKSYATVTTGDVASMDDTAALRCRYPLFQKPVAPAKLRSLLAFVRGWY